MTALPTTSQAAISDLRFEHLREAVGTGCARPRLSWLIRTDEPGWRQSAYELEAATPTGTSLGSTGRVDSDQSVLVPWGFGPLTSRTRVLVRVRVWDHGDRVTDWSRWHAVEAGLLGASDWTASFITPDWDEDPARPQPCPLLRREFDVRPGLTSARLYVTALGVYEAQLNGAVVGDHVLAPGWTSYDYRLRYQTFDVTSLVREGRNALGAMLGDGWYRGRLGFAGGRRNLYGERIALLAQLALDYADGASEQVVTDRAWRAAQGPVRASDLYDGETYDARLERAGWSIAGHDDSTWRGVRLVERDPATLVAPTGPPVRRTETIAPVAITQSPSGRTLVDFGQNLVGRLRITVRGQAGRAIVLRHAEVLEAGELCTRPLRTARATDEYTLRGGDVETWEPRFTFHGFRYVEVAGWPGEVRPEDLIAVVIHSDMERTGWFECSDPEVNRLHENVVWSMRGNFLDIPTDCPQRDERLGWTGDIQVFSPTASFIFDCAGFLQSWLADVSAEQDAQGVVPAIVPNVVGGPAPKRNVPFSVPTVMAGPTVPAAAWGDAAVIVPWVLYQRFGDPGILADQYAGMVAWVDHVATLAGPGRLWNHGFQYGDWLDPSAPPDRPGASRTDPYLVATAYFARSAELVGRAAGVLGRGEDERRYQGLAAEVRAAFGREYVTPSGRLSGDSATAYALALEFALLADAEQRRHAGARLATLVREAGYRVSTGFVGTPLILDALCDAGQEASAHRLLTQRECPSWLYPVTMGATTIWERWDSLRPDGSVNPGQMTSFNHYALGAVADWLHRVVGGLAPAAPGYRRIDVRPRPGGGLTHARTRHLTPYGLAECAWRIDAGRLEVEVVVPPNTAAEVTLPGEAAPLEVGAGRHRWTCPMPDRVRPALSLDSTLAELVDDEPAWRALLAVAPALKGAEVGMSGRADMPVRAVIARLSEATRAKVEEALEALIRRRGSG